MNRKEVILTQFLYTTKKNGWFVCFENAITGLTSEHAAWKNSESDNSIWEIVNHLVFWNVRYLNRFKGIPNPEMEGNNDTTFQNYDVLEWKAIVDQFNEVMSDWRVAINEVDEHYLDQPVHPNDNSGGTWMDSLSSIALHNAYHIGQIVTIRKMQGSWDREQGVH